jgi:8-oxo-dGTP diphosphatase
VSESEPLSDVPPTARSGFLAAEEPVVRAAGAVLWRLNAEGRVEVALVHRPRYDDWSLPKGKLDAGETSARAAVREIHEETGFACVLSRFLCRVEYPVPSRHGGTARKLVDYYCAHASDGAFIPGDEVDELKWAGVDDAHRQLTYSHDSQVLNSFGEIPTDAVTLLLIRHAKAGSRSDWNGDDDLRPLTKNGQEQRTALHALLPLYGPERVYAAPRVRCTDTVEPVASDLGVPIEPEPLLSEEGYRANPQDGVDRLLRIAALPGTALVCSQGGVIPDLVARLAEQAGVEVERTDLGEVPSKKGSVWTLTFRRTSRRDNGASPGLRLAAADYLADPLP